MSNDAFFLDLATRAAAHPEIETALMGALRAVLPKVIDGLIREHAGESLRVYVPKVARDARAARAALLRGQFNGRNIPELAKAQGLSPRQVRRILKTKTHNE